MMKKIMFLATMVAGLFASCADNELVDNAPSGDSKGMTLSINADLKSGSRVGFTPEGEGLKASFQEGDFMIVYFRKADGGWLNKWVTLNYDPTSANGTKATFKASNVVIPEGTGLLHILIGNTRGGVPYVAAGNGECALADNLSEQDGTLDGAALYSVFQADPYTEDNLEVDGDQTKATINNVTFTPKTSVVKMQVTFPEGVTVEQGTELTLTTSGTYNNVIISGGNPGAASLPASASADAVFKVKAAEVSGNVATAYFTIWPGRSDDEFSAVQVAAEVGGKTYAGEYYKAHEGKLEAGKLYTMEATVEKQLTDKTLWVNDAEGDVVEVESSDYDTTTDWLSVAGGKIHAKANETGAARTGEITVGDFRYHITQVEAKDFKGTYTFTTKVFGATGAYKSSADPSSWDVTFGDPRKAVTLTDADGTTKHTNNIGIKGLFFDAVMDACIEIDYENQTAKLGVFYDARPEEAQKIEAEGAANGLYARFVPALATRSNTAWEKPWKFDEVNLGDPNYAWAWYTISADLRTMTYANRSNNGVEFSTLSQYEGSETMNQIVGTDIVLTATADAVPSGYANVYQVNAKGKVGTTFVRK